MKDLIGKKITGFTETKKTIYPEDSPELDVLEFRFSVEDGPDIVHHVQSHDCGDGSISTNLWPGEFVEEQEDSD